jgi:maleylacetate reductase
LKDEQIEGFIQPALDHPQVTRNNLRPITTAEDLRAILALAAQSSTEPAHPLMAVRDF